MSVPSTLIIKVLEGNPVGEFKLNLPTGADILDFRIVKLPAVVQRVVALHAPPQEQFTLTFALLLQVPVPFATGEEITELQMGMLSSLPHEPATLCIVKGATIFNADNAEYVASVQVDDLYHLYQIFPSIQE